METNHYLADFYSTYDEDRRLISKSGSVEFLTTMRYIDKYLHEGDRVLEIGAGTGRYSHAIARRGFRVNSVELLEHNIEVFRRNTLPNENITLSQGNALDLSRFKDGTFDITLLFGPMYHLYNLADKRQAIREAIRVTKKGGVVLVAYVVSDACILDEGFHRQSFDCEQFITDGLIDPITFATKSEPKDLFEMIRKEDIDEIMSGFNVQPLHYVATDGCTLFFCETIDQMDDRKFELYLRFHFAICERSDMVGMTNHTLDVFRKL